MNKAVVIFSGGLDSATLLYWVGQMRDVLPITFYYGQKHEKEIIYSKRLTAYLGVQHMIFDLSNVSTLIGKGALMGHGEVPKEHYSNETQRQTIVPNRNMILISLAVGYAITHGANEVYYGAHKSDYSIYPDCRPEFVKALNTAVYLGNLWTPVELYAPFINFSKTDIVREGLEMGVPYEMTWSCYEGGNEPCGKCGTCQERLEAFQNNKVEDPLKGEGNVHS